MQTLPRPRGLGRPVRGAAPVLLHAALTLLTACRSGGAPSTSAAGPGAVALATGAPGTSEALAPTGEPEAAWADGAAASPSAANATPTEARRFDVAVQGDEEGARARTAAGRHPGARLTLIRRVDGQYDLQLSHGADTTELRALDLRPFVPRLPRLARDDEGLARLSLVERERSRLETTYDGVGEAGLRVRLANTALAAGRWEVAVELPRDGGFTPLFRGYFSFPRAEYARLFEEVNGPRWRAHGPSLVDLPRLSGLPQPLAALRKVEKERPLGPSAVRVHFDEPVMRFGEQERKRKLLLAKGVRTYLDLLAPLRQPVAMAQLVAPGRYDRRAPLRFTLSHLGAPLGATWRRVRPLAPASAPLHEVELRFHDGQRLVLGAADLAALPVRTGPPPNPAGTRLIDVGLGTPPVRAAAAARNQPEAEQYLLLLDAQGDYADRREVGVDGVLLWREGEGKAARLHLWLMGYERISLLAHLSIPFAPLGELPAAR